MCSEQLRCVDCSKEWIEIIVELVCRVVQEAAKILDVSPTAANTLTVS